MSADPLEFVDSKPYKDRIEQAKKSSGLPEAIVSGRGKVGGHLVYAGAMDMSFIGGSMGSAVGEKITRLIERALKNKRRRDNFCRFRRRANAGRNALADANGEDFIGAGATSRRQFAVYFSH